MILPSTIKLLADNKVNTGGWQPAELEHFQTRYEELSKEYIDKLKEPDTDGLKAALALAVIEVEFEASEATKLATSNKLVLALEALCNEQLKRKVQLEMDIAVAKELKVKAEKEFKEKVNRKIIKVQTLTITGEPTFTLKYGEEAAVGAISKPYTADGIQVHLETILPLKGNVTVTGPTDDMVGGVNYAIKYAGKLKRNFVPLAVADLSGVGTISLGY